MFSKFIKKVIVVRLKQNELGSRNKQIIGDFKFTIYRKRNDSFLLPLQQESTCYLCRRWPPYRVINPDQEIIAEGEIEQEKIVPSPYIKTMFEAPLLDKAELMSGSINLFYADGELRRITYFNYPKTKLISL